MGDVNGDDRADVALTAPGASASGREQAGSAYVVFGKSGNAPIDLASLGEGGYAIRGRSGDRLTNVASTGDVDGDDNPEVVLGGAGGVLTLGKSTSETLDLSASPFAGYRMAPPADAGAAPATVAGVGDLNADNGPDTAVGFPSADNGAGRSYAVFGRSQMRDVNLDALPGQRGTRLAGGPGTETGTDSDGSDVGFDEEPTLYTARPRAGPGVVTAQTRRRVRARFDAEKSGCQKRSLWTFPYRGQFTSAVPRCRRAARGTLDIPAIGISRRSKFNPTPSRCREPSETCRPSSYKSGNARLSVPEFDKSANSTESAIYQLRDSFGDPLAQVREVASGCFAIFRVAATTPEARTCGEAGNRRAPASIELQGKACMATDALESDHWLVRVQQRPKYTGTRPGPLFAGLQGYVTRNALDSTLTSREERLARRAFTGCGVRASRQLKPVADPVLSTDGFTSERYLGPTNAETCGATDPDCGPGGRYANYQGSFIEPANVALVVSTTATPNGGIVRAIAPRDGASRWRRYDRMGYVDPNVPCAQRRAGRWEYGAANPGGDRTTRCGAGSSVARSPETRGGAEGRNDRRRASRRGLDSADRG